MLFRKIALVGVGLLGGSLALAIRERKLAEVVQGYVRRDASLAECERAGLRNFATQDLIAAVRDADLVILCTPLAQMRGLVERALPALKPAAIVSDVGSVKGSVVAELEPIVARSGAHFVGAHPMAGAEKSGVAAARADLFCNSVCVLTPGRSGTDASPVTRLASASACSSDSAGEGAGRTVTGEGACPTISTTTSAGGDAVQQLETFWRALGARVLVTTPELHDELVARCSHLPHVLAAQLANYVLDASHAREQPLLCANGFRDTTRIASGSPEMWRDIAIANREQLDRALDDFIRGLQAVQRAVKNGDGQGLEEFFVRAKQRRDAWCAQGASPSPE